MQEGLWASSTMWTITWGAIKFMILLISVKNSMQQFAVREKFYYGETFEAGL
jgi:hypothetical protein